MADTVKITFVANEVSVIGKSGVTEVTMLVDGAQLVEICRRVEESWQSHPSTTSAK